MIISDIIIENETETNITINKESWLRIKQLLGINQEEKVFNKAKFKKYINSIQLSQDPLEFQKEIRNER